MTDIFTVLSSAPLLGENIGTMLPRSSAKDCGETRRRRKFHVSSGMNDDDRSTALSSVQQRSAHRLGLACEQAFWSRMGRRESRKKEKRDEGRERRREYGRASAAPTTLGQSSLIQFFLGPYPVVRPFQPDPQPVNWLAWTRKNRADIKSAIVKNFMKLVISIFRMNQCMFMPRLSSSRFLRTNLTFWFPTEGGGGEGC